MDEPTNVAAKSCQFIAAITVCFSGISVGAVIGWSSPALEMIKDNLHEPHLDPWVGSVVGLGAAAAMIVMAFALNTLGRKLVMLLLVIPFTVGWLILAFVETIPLYCVGRVITGFCVGSYSAAVPIFVSEIAEKRHRGKMGIFMQLFQVIGVSYAYNVGSATNIRNLSLACLVPNLIFAAVFFFIPETPYFYRMKRKNEKAVKSLQWYRGKNYDIAEEFQEIEDFVHISEELKKLSFKEKFLNLAVRRALVIGIGLLIFQQVIGKSFLTMYILTIFKESNPIMDPEYCQILVGVLDMFLTAVSILFIDRCGRKFLLTISFVGMGICHVLLGVYFYILERHTGSLEDYGWVPLVLACLFSASFTVGVGPVPSIVLGELFSQMIKAKACAICYFFRWIFYFMAPFTYRNLAEEIGYAYLFWIFAVTCVLSVLFVIFVCIETNGKTFQEIYIQLLSENT